MGLVTHSSSPRIIRRIVFYTASTALKWGQGLCYDRDYYGTATGTTAADACGLRDRRVENPTTANMNYFAGVTRRAYAAKTGGQWIEICEPGSVCEVYTDQSCTLATTALSLNTSGYFTARGNSPVEVIALQTVDRSSTNGVVMAYLGGSPSWQGSYGTAAGRGPSPAIWGDCPWDALVRNPELGVAFFDDFLGPCLGQANAAAVTEGFGQYGAYADINAAGSILAANLIGGAISFDPDGDNELVAIGTNGFMAAGQTTYTKPWWFEARFKVSTIADTKFGVFCGLYEPGILATNVPLTDAGGFADKDLIGFHRLEGDGDKLDTLVGLAGSGQTNVKADAITLVADTFVKVGMKFDGTTVTFYSDGTALDDTVDTDDTDFPDDQIMGLCFAHNNAAADPGTSTLDWWRAAILY